MEECKHKWVFQETKKKVSTSKANLGGYVAHFHRVDVYYCENCCKINEREMKESVNLPFGGIHNVLTYRPVWY